VVDGTIAAPTGPAAVSDPEAVLRGLAHVFRQSAERASLGWQLYRVAAVTDPQVAADRAELERLRRNTLAGAISRIDESALRPGLTRDDAVDTSPGGGEPAEPRDARRRRWSQPRQLRAVGRQDPGGRAPSRPDRPDRPALSRAESRE